MIVDDSSTLFSDDIFSQVSSRNTRGKQKVSKGDLRDFFDACLKLFSGVSRLFDWFNRGGSGFDKALTGENFTDGRRVLHFRRNVKVLATDCGESGLTSQWE
jgi:hypothetical protein